MIAILLDTHTWVWSLFQSSELDPAARRTIETAQTVYVPPCSFPEITQKHRSGKWPEVGDIVRRLPQLLRAQGRHGRSLHGRDGHPGGRHDWSHRDPFDRLIAATAIELACPLVSKDTAFDDLDGFPGWKGRFWSEAAANTS